MSNELDPKTKLYVQEQLDIHREVDDARYALKLVERIVFALLGVFALAVIYRLLGTINL